MNTNVNESVVRTDNEIMESVGGGLNKTQRKDVFQVDPKLLTIELGHNVRDFETERVLEHIQGLSNNIGENGVLTPLECRRESIGKDANGETVFKYVIIDGECRYRAIRLLQGTDKEICRVPVILERTGNSTADRVLDMLNANESLRFSPIELACAYKKFIHLGWTVSEIADKLGKSINHVNDCLSLLEYDENVISSIKTKKVSANNIRQLDKKVKEEGITDDYARKKEVSRRLEIAIERAEEEENADKIGGKINVAKYLEIKQSAEERLISAIELVTSTLNRWNFTSAQLQDLLEDLHAGQSMQNAINKVFGAQLLDTNVAVSNAE